ncbi:MAG: DUF2029 domain-containing protein [Anaerolineales bacterium]|nr:DUF2029 domain-containing protein [Anaerolineales bacterium]
MANQRGYLAAYDLNQLMEIQNFFIPKSDELSSYTFYPVITFFLPIYLLPFQILARFSLIFSFVLWTSLNFFGQIFYLVYFLRSLSLPFKWRHLLLCCLFWPFYISIYWGQIGMILVIATGEFFRAYQQLKPWRAGFRLGILMIKPQNLVLLLFVLLIQRQWKTLLGFGIVSAVLVLVSVQMVGIRGFQTLLDLSKILAGAYPTVAPTGMINWRMLGENFTVLGLPTLGWGLAWVGIILTFVYVAFHFSANKINRNNSAAAFLAIFAATCLVSWHYHVHSAIVLIPFLLHLLLGNKSPETWLLSWILIPALVMFLTDVITLVLHQTGWVLFPSYPGFLQGSCGLVLSIYTVLQATKLFRRLSYEECSCF